MKNIIMAVMLFVGIPLFGQNQWVRTEKTDALRGTSYTQFTLTGKFLTPPRQSAPDPVFVMKCVPGDHRHGATWEKEGKILDAYITIGAVVDHRANVQYRVDDGKINTELMGGATDGQAVFPNETQLNRFFYGHFLPHKEGTGDPTHKIVVAVDEYLGAQIVMQFNMPDPTQMADACGLILHKR